MQVPLGYINHFCLKYLDVTQTLLKCYEMSIHHSCQAYMICRHFYTVNIHMIQHLHCITSVLSTLLTDNITGTHSIIVHVAKTPVDIWLAAHLVCPITRSTVRPNNSITHQILLYETVSVPVNFIFPHVSWRHLENGISIKARIESGAP